jgi:branched-subunit amino acid transport protein AzlD
MDELETSNLEMLEQAEYFDSLNAEDFESMDNAEFAEYLDFLDDLEDAEVRKGRKKHASRAHRGGLRRGLVPKKKKKKHVVPLKGRAKLSATGGGGGYKAPATSDKNPAYASPGYVQQVMATSKGDLNITVIRETATIALALPYILFDSNGFQSSYVSTLKQYLPAGVTAVASVDPATGDVLIRYTQGILVDQIRITLTGSQISYSEFLNNMNTNFFKTFYIRQEYQNTADLLLSVSQTINFGLLSALGMNNKNNLLPRSRRLSSDFQTFIINLFISEQRITSDFSFVQNAIAVANTTIAWDIFMSERTNLNNM